MFDRRTAAAALLAIVLAACGRSAATGPGSAAASSGALPAPADDASPAALVRCDREGDDVRIEAVVTNGDSTAALLQGVPFSVVDARGRTVIEEDDTSGLWRSVQIGPGRQTLVADTVDLGDAAPGDVTCVLGEPDLRPRDRVPPVGDADVDALTLTGCTDRHAVGFTNPHDAPVATAITIEFFDAGGFSAGQMTFGQQPATYTDGRAPGPFEVALDPRATASYPITVEARAEEWDMPIVGAVTSCEVIDVAIVVDPPTTEVIVD